MRQPWGRGGAKALGSWCREKGGVVALSCALCPRACQVPVSAHNITSGERDGPRGDW